MFHNYFLLFSYRYDNIVISVYTFMFYPRVHYILYMFPNFAPGRQVFLKSALNYPILHT